MKNIHPDSLILLALLFIGVGLHQIYPAATPYFILLVGVATLGFWLLIAKGGRRN